MRKKSLQADEGETNEAGEIEMITGPLYELPRALLDNRHGKDFWTKLLRKGGIPIGPKTDSVAWCPRRGNHGSFRSEPLVDKHGKPRSEMMSCTVQGSRMRQASTDPNRLRITYKRSERSFPLRAPLGYFKLMVLKTGSRLGRRTCAWIMDQVGQCLLVSVELLGKIAHLDFQGSEWELKGGLDVQDKDSSAEYNAYVNPYWCIPPGGTLRKKESCMLATNTVEDPDDITLAMMDHYWKRHLEAKSKK